MTIYVVSSNYFNSGIFGIYSSIKRAQIAFEDFLVNNKYIVTYKKLNGYCYQFTTQSKETFKAEIYYDVLDAEFIAGICKKG